ncbi:MAG: right-handed parallel beta-helix repeat-containing protein [Verrucomicrobia bacterium]|nr:right-handed parallel beta-helix repeat-containing protein [Verrucomicrobiota bacterium]
MKRREFLRRSSLAGMAGIGAAALVMRSFAEPEEKTHDTRLNVLDFGAKGDGKTSDTDAIQKALDAAGKINGTVYFPAGIYRCHGLKVPAYVTLLGDPCWIYHCEKRGAVLELDSRDTDCLLDITGAFAARIRGMVLCGIPNAEKPIHGIYLNNKEKWSPKEDTIVIDDTKVMNFSGHGVFFRRVWLFIVRHSQFMSNKGDGIRLLGWDGFVTDNQFSANGGNGFGCDDVGATVMFTANRVEWNRGYGLFIHGGDDWNVTGNSFDRNHGAGLYALKAQAVTVTGNVFRRCGKDSSYLSEGEHSCQVRLEDCHGFSMTGNTCLAGQDDGGKGLFTPQVGFIVKKMSHSVIMGNTLWNGYMNEMIVDQGEHGEDFILKDNVGCAKKA